MDQEGMLREGLRALIDSEERLSVTHLVDRTEGLRALAEGSASPPDIIVADFGAATINPRETVGLAREHWPHVPILVLTLDRREEAIELALRLGVNGYLLKSERWTDLLNAIHAVQAGKRHISPTIFDTVVEGFVHPGSHAAESDGLSERERQVLKLIAAGLRTREIAEKLCVSFKTVDKHRTNLMRKLGVRTAAAVAAYAILNGYYP